MTRGRASRAGRGKSSPRPLMRFNCTERWVAGPCMSTADEVIELQAGGILVSPDPLFNSRRAQVVALAARHAVPALSVGRIRRGRRADQLRTEPLGGPSPGRHLHRKDSQGAKSAEQPTRFELVVNIETAKALGLAVAPLILGRADEVIE